MALETSSKALDNKGVQWHLLATKPQSQSSAITQAEEFFAIGSSARVTSLEQDTPEEDPILKLLETVWKAITQQGEAFWPFSGKRLDPL